jgi:hypothetical protein
MAVELNHTIVAARDKMAAATFLTTLLGLPAPTSFGPFQVVTLSNGVSLDQHKRRWSRCVLRRSRRPRSGAAHPPLRQRIGTVKPAYRRVTRPVS